MQIKILARNQGFAFFVKVSSKNTKLNLPTLRKTIRKLELSYILTQYPFPYGQHYMVVRSGI